MKGILLFSSGIDSPVAGHLANKKGIELIALNFYNKELTEDYKNKLIALAKLVNIKKIYFANMNSFQTSFYEKCNKKLQCVFCKRMMLRIAESVLKKEEADFVVNGDNIAQVASQTIENMSLISSVTDKTILRPVLCFDKNEIVKIAREIKTYDINLGFKGKCPFVPNNPATRTSFEKILSEEERINLEQLKDEIINGLIVVDDF
jgi:tRNA uracil 4-sulfurtransferase